MNKKQKRFAFIGLLVSAAALATGLTLTALNASVAYFYTPSDLQTALQGETGLPKGTIRLGGLVQTGSIVHGAGETAEVTFTVEDGTASSSVIYVGVLPDLFREGQGVVVEGSMGRDNIFRASRVLAKHDETYMPREVADALKEQGHWRDDAETTQ
ncbi:MAG: cytochrome c maturation protein CcmE [Pseudomonadota bacterium]